MIEGQKKPWIGMDSLMLLLLKEEMIESER